MAGGGIYGQATGSPFAMVQEPGGKCNNRGHFKFLGQIENHLPQTQSFPVYQENGCVSGAATIAQGLRRSGSWPNFFSLVSEHSSTILAGLYFDIPSSSSHAMALGETSISEIYVEPHDFNGPLQPLVEQIAKLQLNFSEILGEIDYWSDKFSGFLKLSKDTINILIGREKSTDKTLKAIGKCAQGDFNVFYLADHVGHFLRMHSVDDSHENHCPVLSSLQSQARLLLDLIKPEGLLLGFVKNIDEQLQSILNEVISFKDRIVDVDKALKQAAQLDLNAESGPVFQDAYGVLDEILTDLTRVKDELNGESISSLKNSEKNIPVFSKHEFEVFSTCFQSIVEKLEGIDRAFKAAPENVRPLFFQTQEIVNCYGVPWDKNVLFPLKFVPGPQNDNNLWINELVNGGFLSRVVEQHQVKPETLAACGRLNGVSRFKQGLQTIGSRIKKLISKFKLIVSGAGWLGSLAVCVFKKLSLIFTGVRIFSPFYPVISGGSV